MFSSSHYRQATNSTDPALKMNVKEYVEMKTKRFSAAASDDKPESMCKKTSLKIIIITSITDDHLVFFRLNILVS